MAENNPMDRLRKKYLRHLQEEGYIRNDMGHSKPGRMHSGGGVYTKSSRTPCVGGFERMQKACVAFYETLENLFKHK